MQKAESFSDLEIFRNFKNGDQSAFAQIFENYYQLLVVFAKKYLNDLDLSKGIVQDFFVRFYEKREEIEIKTSLKSYLYLSVRNTCLNYIEKKNIQNRHHQNIQYTSTELSEEVAEKIETTEIEHEIFKHIEDLPDQCKRIFKMSRVDSKKNQEIADELKISKRTVETQISKALKILREKLTTHIKLLIFIILHFFQ